MHPIPLKPVILHSIDIAAVPPETFADPNEGGDVSWKTLLSSPKTATNTFTVGIATCKPGARGGCYGHLKSHRHKQAEIYYIMSGNGVVTIEGSDFEVEKGTMVWIPGDAEHGVRNEGSENLVWLYAFAVDSFGEIAYRFDRSGPQKIRAKL